jgi:Uma2 family endonuclease
MQQVKAPDIQEELLANQYYRLTVDDYYKMAEVGIFAEDARVELIEGMIVEMSPIGNRHANVVDLLTVWFAELLTSRQALIRVQGPIYLDEQSEVIPDLMLLRWRSSSRAPHPTANEVLLVAEVAHSSIVSDRTKKVPLYANAELPELWIVDLTRDVVEVYTNPSPGGYETLQTYHSGELLAPQAFPSLTHDVGDLFQ